MRLILVIPVFIAVLPPFLQVQDKPLGAEVSERIGSYVRKEFLVLGLQEDWEKQYAKWKSEYKQLTRDEKIEYCIFQLRNESWNSFDGVRDKSPYSDEPEATASRELIKLGRHAIPRLLDAMKSRVSTGIYYSRFPQQPWLIQDVALHVIENIACRSLERDGPSVSKLSGLEEIERQKLQEEVRGWWTATKDPMKSNGQRRSCYLKIEFPVETNGWQSPLFTNALERKAILPSLRRIVAFLRDETTLERLMKQAERRPIFCKRCCGNRVKVSVSCSRTQSRTHLSACGSREHAVSGHLTMPGA